MSKITILGGGRFGTALAAVYGNRYHLRLTKVYLWVRPESRTSKGDNLADYIKNERINPCAFPEMDRLPKGVNITDNLEKAVSDSEIVINTIPSEYLKGYLEQLKDCSFSQFVNGSKGVIDGRPIYEAFRYILGDRPYAALAGPNIAAHLMRFFSKNGEKPAPILTTIAYDPQNVVPNLERKMNSKGVFLTVPSDDPLAIEYCSWAKQTYAMVLGLASEIKDNHGKNRFDNSSIASLFYLCGSEIVALLKSFDMDPAKYAATPAGYPDLLITYQDGRNGKAGKLIATYGLQVAKEKLAGQCVEGFRVVAGMQKVAVSKGLDLPLLNMMHDVLYAGVSPNEAFDRMYDISRAYPRTKSLKLLSREFEEKNPRISLAINRFLARIRRNRG